MILFTAKHLSDYENKLNNPRAYWDPILVLIPAMLLLFNQPDLLLLDEPTNYLDLELSQTAVLWIWSFWCTKAKPRLFYYIG